MLRSPKNSVLHLAPPSHVDVFVEHYEQLRKWALKFTENDQEAAEDLLHDTFINLTLSKPDLTSIQNIEGYLFIVMRNLHLSQVRRATRLPVRSFSVVEYDTAEMPFWASDPREHLRMRDELAAVCRIACIRKESSKGGSLLILRFFHGYYPDEIAEVMRTTRTAVRSKLKKVRLEVKLYFQEPERLRFIEDKLQTPVSLNTTYSGEDMRLRLRSYIFESCRGECLTDDTLNAIYVSHDVEFPGQQELAHIVSCPNCIEKVNTILGLAPLSSRYAVDMVGNDPGGPKDGPGGGMIGGGGGTSGPGGNTPMLDSYINRREAHFYHEPQELCVSVNGQFQGGQRIVSGKGDLVLSLDTSETLGFVEVFSELGVRLLMLNVEPPPVGDGNQSAQVELSDGRTINANLNFGSAHPSLQVIYNDPETIAIAEAASAMDATEAPGMSVAPALAGEAAKTPLLSKEGWQRLPLTGWLSLFDLRSWLQPARITTAFAALLIASLIIFQFGPFTAVSAAELLNKSAQEEVTVLANRERVLHRTLDVEEFKGDQLVSRKKIDVWHSAERGVTARRVYDEQGKLVTGDWRNASGIQTVYNRGEAAKLQPLPEKRGAAILTEGAWQLSLSAKEFNALIGNPEQATYEERDNEYGIKYERTAVDFQRRDAETQRGSDSLSVPPAVAGGLSQPQSQDGLIRASLVLSKEDLHATAQSFTVRAGEETREYRMTEAAYELRPANTVAPEVFEPNVELTGDNTKRLTTTPSGETPATPPIQGGELGANTNTNTAPSATMATAALEVEVIEALNNAGAFTGEQIDVSRTGDGKISVTALVETAARKQALMNALANVRNNPAVRLNIETVAEAEARVRKQKTQANPNVSIQQVEVSENSNPVYAELRKRFSDEEARRFADRVLSRSRSVRAAALAMRQLSGRFSAADLQTLTSAERSRWLALIRGHAERFINEAEALRREVQPVFSEAAAGNTGGGGSISSDAELQTRARDLYEATVTIDRGLGRSFALTADGNSGAPVGTTAFWRQFSQAVGMARSIAAAK